MRGATVPPFHFRSRAPDQREDAQRLGMTRTLALSLATTALWLATSGSSLRAPEQVLPNDNTRPAGTFADGVLAIALETRAGSWRPDGDSGKSIDNVIAFAEVRRAPSTPGPLIRVPVGTRVRGTLHNTLNRPLTVFGLGKRRGFADSVVVAAGATSPFEFAADQPGTFFYTARTHVDTLIGRDPLEGQLNGAIVVDRPNAPRDRILGITWSIALDFKSPNGLGAASMALNGRSWPHTERLSYAQDDSVRWRVVNFTEYNHPMHLHGFYFRVDSRSDGAVDTVYSGEQRRMAVTENLEPFQAVQLSWKAERAGNWVFHCHYAVHISDAVSLDMHNGMLDPSAHTQHESDRPHQMYGLVMGISVTPKGPPAAFGAPERIIRIEQRERPKVYGDQPGMSFVVTKGGRATDTSTMPVPGPTLVLERGKRVQVTVVNRSQQHAAVHWHGIELESYPDGVPGWSGSGTQTLPSIAPSDSLTVRWTPPRAGSFMYHSHFNEAKQMGGGLYGPIVVLEPGARFDPETDRVLFFGTAGYITNFLAAPPAVLLNGSVHPGAMELKANTRYRFRLFNLAGDAPTFVSLMQGTKPVEWRAVAKDGYPLPASQASMRPARLVFVPGEIYDFEFTPRESGDLTLAFGLPQPPPKPDGSIAGPPLVNVVVHVR
jgi:FtsP/CotA-like multicopper oxidase with cupredoxin domain